MTFATYPSLEGMPVLVTGGASGIGADIVRAFDHQGARVGFLDIQDDAGQALVTECPNTVFAPADVTDISALQSAVAQIANRIGPIRCLVNNAANDKREDIDAITTDDWDMSQNINLRPHFFAAQAVRAGMAQAGGGSIINLSSIAWRLGSGNMAPYATAKAGVLGLTKTLADGFGSDNIRVNAIEPGAVMTQRQRELWFTTEQAVHDMVERQLIGRVLSGDDIARMVLFLASDDSQMITKQSFVVDAGLL